MRRAFGEADYPGRNVTSSPPHVSVFPKCCFDELVSQRRRYVDWIHDAATLGGDPSNAVIGGFDPIAFLDRSGDQWSS